MKDQKLDMIKAIVMLVRDVLRSLVTLRTKMIYSSKNEKSNLQSRKRNQ